MGHLPKLIEDLALILIVGASVTLLFKRIKQPLVLGYIIAGLLVGPHLKLFPTVADTANVKTLAEIGVIFLLFSLGLEFSFKKLIRVGGSASITAFVEIIFITLAGYFTGKLLGWSTMDSLFLGGMLASSSTTIIIRAFDELGVKTKQFARIVFGVLVVEDIVVILLMVMLSTIAVTREFEGTQMLFTLGKLLFFLILWFIAGIFLLPTFLKKLKNILDEETLLILSIGLCLGMVVVATTVGFSAELGAFIMGSILAETTKAEKVEHIIKPVKDLFGAIFFVSVGMLIDPQAIMEYGVPVVIITLLTIFGKLFSTTLGAILSGQPLKQSIEVGMSMAQIGEFAFIVATLGLSLGVISDFLFPVAVGVSAITTFTTPYMISYSGHFYSWLEGILPKRWLLFIENYASSSQSIQSENNWKPVIRNYTIQLVTNGILCMSMIMISLNFIKPILVLTFSNQNFVNIATLFISLILCAPFLFTLVSKQQKSSAYKELWVDNKYNRGPLLGMEIIRIIIGISLIGFLVDNLFNTFTAMLIVITITVLGFYIFNRRIAALYSRLEGKFLKNLNEREFVEKQIKNNKVEGSYNKNLNESQLIPWDIHIAELEIDPHSTLVDIPLKELKWKENYGINISYIKRGDYYKHVLSKDEKLFPYDKIGIITTDDQIAVFKTIFDNSIDYKGFEERLKDLVILNIKVNEHNHLSGQTIEKSRIRERIKGIVLGIERNNERIINPSSLFEFEFGDIIWLAGERAKINNINEPII